MGNVQCSCSDIIKNLIIDTRNLVEITKLQEPYSIKKVLMIQSVFRRFQMTKLFNKIKHTKTKDKTIEEEKQFRVKSSKSKKSKKKKRVTNVDVSNEALSQSQTQANNTDNKKELTPNSTFLGDTPYQCLNPFDLKYCPGKVIEIESVVLLPEVKKAELSLTEFIIEEKELLKYFESYPFKLKHFQLEYPNGIKYNGYYGPEWTKEGFGILINSDGSKFEGMFNNNLCEGRGRLILNKGDYYEGEFSQDKANGYGKYVSTEGEIYLGYWMNDKQHGRGELILKDGSRYEGNFANGMKSGKGRLSWPDTSYYEGDFVSNYFEGYGSYYMRNGKIFKGEWKRGKMEGVGIFIWPEGKKYIGTYHQDKKNGYGIYIGKDGKKYEGQFKNGKQHGIGLITDGGNTLLFLYQKGKKMKWLNEVDFKDDIKKIKDGIKAINNQINSIDFFNDDFEYSLSYNKKSKTTNIKDNTSISSNP